MLQGMGDAGIPCGSLVCNYCYSETLVGSSIDPTLTIEQPSF
jgi:hypothetical protein